jgi:hypothetical protein
MTTKNPSNIMRLAASATFFGILALGGFFISLSTVRADAQSQKIPIVFFPVSVDDAVVLKHVYGLSDLSKMISPRSAADAGYYSALVVEDRMDDFFEDWRVSWASKDGRVVNSTITTNDQYFTDDATHEEKQWYLPKIKMPQAWDYGRGTSNIVVAVVDTGIHASHIELNDGRIIEGYDTIEEKSIPANSNSDDNGHGTAVAGIIGAISDNNRGIAGINRDVRIMPVKAMSADGTGLMSDVTEAIIWATDHGASIINLSMGGPNFGSDKALNEAIKYAYEKDVVVVAAAGNDQIDVGLNLDTVPGYPICADQGKNMVIGVAATDINDKKALFSNFGINCIDISAPGKKILTTAYFPNNPSENVLIYGSGTSLSAPIVSGVAALLRSNNPNLINTRVRDILISSTDSIDQLNTQGCLGTSCSGFLGSGRINALSALSPQPILNGSFIRQTNTGKIFQINRGSKRFVPEKVFAQRGFDPKEINAEIGNQLDSLPTNDALTPLNGTLVKSASNPAVYYVADNQLYALSYTVFTLRNFSFAQILVITDDDMANYKPTGWYWPPDQTLLQERGNSTVYVMTETKPRPLTYFVFTQRKYSFAKIVNISRDEFLNLPKVPDAYWMPPVEGALVKSDTSPVVYLIQNQSRKPISYEAFMARRLSFAAVNFLAKQNENAFSKNLPVVDCSCLDTCACFASARCTRSNF